MLISSKKTKNGNFLVQINDADCYITASGKLLSVYPKGDQWNYLIDVPVISRKFPSLPDKEEIFEKLDNFLTDTCESGEWVEGGFLTTETSFFASGRKEVKEVFEKRFIIQPMIQEYLQELGLKALYQGDARCWGKVVSSSLYNGNFREVQVMYSEPINGSNVHTGNRMNPVYYSFHYWKVTPSIDMTKKQFFDSCMVLESLIEK